VTNKKDADEKKPMQRQPEERDRGTNLRGPIRTVALTAASAGAGILGAIAGITVAGVFEIALPIGLCLWAGGVTCGAIGLAFGMGKKRKSE